MQHPILLFFVIVAFGSFICDTVIANMINDKNAVVRFLGYIIAVVMAIAVLWLVLYCFFNINLLSIL